MVSFSPLSMLSQQLVFVPVSSTLDGLFLLFHHSCNCEVTLLCLSWSLSLTFLFLVAFLVVLKFHNKGKSLSAENLYTIPYHIYIIHVFHDLWMVFPIQRLLKQTALTCFLCTHFVCKLLLFVRTAELEKPLSLTNFILNEFTIRGRS